ncbi:MAG: hypothetical protein OXC30_00375 [Alphaproteobacteria bacterium]|nr:hypothetical protein [Alphaproteobacteria bacterium]
MLLSLILFFICLHGNVSASTIAKEAKDIWWSHTQKLIDAQRSALLQHLPIVVTVEVEGAMNLMPAVDSHIKVIRQSAQPVIDILKNLNMHDTYCGILPDIQALVRYYNELSKRYDCRKSQSGWHIYAAYYYSAFTAFFACVDLCCRQEPELAAEECYRFVCLYDHINTPSFLG